MLIVVTGGIGSGKTYVTKIFETLNIPILYADQIAKDIILTNKNIYDTIQKYFNVFNLQKNLKKIKIEIFKYKKKRLFLENIIHQKVLEKIANINTNCIVEIPLLHNLSNLLTFIKFDKLILVNCDKNIQISRVMHRDKLSKSQVISIINSQLSISHGANKIQQLADYIVDGNKLDQLHMQAINLCLLLKNMLQNIDQDIKTYPNGVNQL